MIRNISHPDALVIIEDLGKKRKIIVIPNKSQSFPKKEWVSRYSSSLIEEILEIKGPEYLCDEIMRDEDPKYVEHSFYWNLLSYVDATELRGRRILDFGSGSGASSIVLARMFPESTIVGVELVPEYLKIAKMRAEFYGYSDRVSFLLSPDSNRLPENIGDFNIIIVSAVFEHMLPEERKSILPLLWMHLKHDGIQFIDQTPYRWFPIELHTTGLPLINYLPEKLALLYARAFSRHVEPNSTWPELLRRGIRGSTAKEVISLFKQNGIEPTVLTPTRNGVKNHIDLWYNLSSTTRKPFLKKAMKIGFQIMMVISGQVVVPTLSLAFQKVD